MRPGTHAHLADLAIRGSAPACTCPATAASIALDLTLRRIRRLGLATWRPA